MSEPLIASHRLLQIADRQTWQAKVDELRVKEKAHTRAGGALAAQRRRLPMVEVDSTTKLIGADGPVSLIDIFDGRSQLIAYFQMWHTGKPAAEQREGCTFSTTHINELSYLNSRGASYATFLSGAVRGELALSRLHGLDGSLVLGAVGRRGPVGRRPALRHPGQLSPGR